MQFDIGFSVLVAGLAIINVSPYSALIYVLVCTSLPVTDWFDYWLLTVVSLVFGFIFRFVNPWK